MPTYTAADAANPATVRAALEAALVSGLAAPHVRFGDCIRAECHAHGWTVRVRESATDQWGPARAYRVTTDQAVAAIVAARTGRKQEHGHCDTLGVLRLHNGPCQR